MSMQKERATVDRETLENDLLKNREFVDLQRQKKNLEISEYKQEL